MHARLGSTPRSQLHLASHRPFATARLHSPCATCSGAGTTLPLAAVTALSKLRVLMVAVSLRRTKALLADSIPAKEVKVTRCEGMQGGGAATQCAPPVGWPWGCEVPVVCSCCP